MMLLLSIFFSIPTLFLTYCLNKKTGNKLNPASLMVYIWLSLLVTAVIFGKKLGFYQIESSVIIIVTFFLDIILIITNVFTKRSKSKLGLYKDIFSGNLGVSDKFIFHLSIFLFVAFIFSQIVYFVKLSHYISINSLLASMWRWKNLVLTGEFSEDSLLYLGRNIQITGTIIAISFLINQGVRKKLSLVLLVLYTLLIFINPRRDPIIDKLIYVACPFIFYYKGKITKLIKWVAPVLVLFAVLFSSLSSALSFGTTTVGDSLGAYTFASFNSLQKAMNIGYSSDSTLIGGNTFYFVYMVLKYLFPKLTPPGIVMDFIGGQDSVNVYTALIAPWMDANGNWFVFLLLLIIYAILIGSIFAFSWNYMKKNNNISALILSSAVYACAIRSYMNPTFSYAEILIAIIYILFVKIVTNSKA